MRCGVILGGLTAAVLALVPALAASPKAPVEAVKARLVPEAAAVAPGDTIWVDLHLDIAPGWHTYWKNPGDSGLPTEIAWSLPTGFSAGEADWPVPERFVTGTIGNYGYSGTADLLVPITAPANASVGVPAHLEAHVSWLVCSDICIPGEAALALDLPVAAEPVSAAPTAAALFAAVRARLPQPAGFETRFALTPGEVRLAVPDAAIAGLANPTVEFFPSDGNLLDASAAPKQQRSADGIQVTLARITGPTAATPQTLAGVLVLHDTAGAERSYTVAAQPGAAGPPGAAETAAAIVWWQALLFALLGGIALNLMPCVFPVLSLKVMGLAESVHRAEQRRHGLAYAAGAILSFTALGGVLLALRDGGAAIGWGFQLQSPAVVALLAYLLFAMGLSLSGVAEFGGALAGFGGRFADKGGMAGAFATGVLAAVVASPCTAPFMGAALGFAIVAPAPLALAVFVALGCGLALPLGLASAVPGIARLLPRPGGWMVWFKQLLAFPLYGTVAWLIWVLMQEVGPGDAFTALLGLVAVAFAMWVYGRTRMARTSGRRFGAGLALAAAAGAIVLAVMLTPVLGSAGAATGRGGLAYETFSDARLAELTAEHRPAFVNLTAAWCITCLVNEKTALDSAAVRRSFADRHIAALKGDWTRQDPQIAAFLQRFGRSGVPLYLLYDKTGTATVLPQILTETGVLDAVGKI